MKLRLSRFIPGQTWRRRPRALVAMILTLALAACGALTLAYWQHEGTSGFKWLGTASAMDGADTARMSPLAIRPVVGHLIPVSATQREWLQQQIRPPRTVKATSSYCLHLLRVHGLNAHFEHSKLPSSEKILELLTDEDSGAAYFGRAALIRTRSGFRFPTGEDEAAVHRDPALEQHRDHTLAAFAELGLPLSYPLRLEGRQLSLREVLRDSLANFHAKQKELPWTGLAYALYLPPAKEWQNRYGERYSFDDLTSQLLGQSLEEASCGGSHLLYTLTILARVDQQIPILSEPVRTRLWERLSRSVHVAIQTQQPDGSWRAGWNHELLPDSAPQGWTALDSPENRLILTGHLTEWMLYLPPNLPVPPQVFGRAGHWLHQQLLAATVEKKEQLFCPYSHAACALRQITFVSDRESSRRLTADE